MRMQWLFFICVILLVCTGCTIENQQPALEELSLISAIAFDYIDESSMNITAAMPQPAEESSKHTQTFTVQASLIKEAILQIAAQSDGTVSLSQLRVVFFSEEFAEKGKMEEVVKYFYRDTEVRENVHLAIVNGNAGEVITSEYPDKPNTSVYLITLLEPKNFTSFSPFTDLHMFLYEVKNPVLDPQVPYLEMKEGFPEITKLALFSEDRMVDTLSRKDGRIVQSLTGLKKISPMDFILEASKTT